jgi:uncharacterized membrane protein
MSCLYFLKTFYDIASIVLNAFIFYAICVWLNVFHMWKNTRMKNISRQLPP